MRSPRPRRATGWGRSTAALALVMLALAGACGTGDESAEPSRFLRVLMTDDWVTPPFLDAVREFERAHPGVKVDVERGPIPRMPDAVRAGIANGKPPDVVQGHAFSAASQKLAQPIDDLWEGRLRDDEYLPGAVDDVTWAGRRYGVPLDTNALVLMYSVDRFAAANLAPPSDNMTFGDFERLAQAITDGNRKAIAFPTSSWWTYGWIKANGGEIITIADDGTPQLSLDAPEVVQAVDYLAGLVRKGYAFPPIASGAHAGDALALFRSGSALVHASGSWDLAAVRRGSAPGSYRAVAMPTGITGNTRGSAMGGSSLFIPNGAPNRDLAFEFMLLLTSDPYALRLAKEQGRLPVRPRVYDDPFFQDPDLKVILDQLRTARPPKLEAYPEALAAFDAALDQVLRGGQDTQSVLRDAQQRAVAALAAASPP